MKSSAFNVLILSAGRRVELVNIWKNTIKDLLGKECNLFACDLNSDHAAACHFADQKFNICSCLDDNYQKLLLEECLKREIKFIIPTIDTELISLAKARKLFLSNGIQILISDLSLIDKCMDKKQTKNLFDQMNINSPRILEKQNLTFPCFIKPIKGSSSIGTRKVFSIDQLSKEDLSSEKNIFQELIDSNWNEFTLDLLYSKDSFLKVCIPRKRLEIRSGEISKGFIKKEKFYYNILSDFKYLEGARGAITLQVFCRENSSDYSAIEINPRFGGGYPMSHMVGANFPEILLKEYFFKEEISFNDNWSENYLFLRYDSTHLCLQKENE